MKVSYVVLSCELYKDKLDSIKTTWAKNVDLIVLTDDMSDVKGYASCPYKYKHFFETHVSSSDWYMLVDDDTYVNVSVLESNSSIDANSINMRQNSYSTAIGSFGVTYTSKKELLISGEYQPNEQLTFPRGGAGIIINEPCFKLIQNYVRSNVNIPITHNSDTTLGMWMTMCGVKHIVYDKRLRKNHYEVNDAAAQMNTGEIVTCHYVTPNEMLMIHELVNNYRNE